MDTLPRAFSSTRAPGASGDLGPLLDKLEHTARAGQAFGSSVTTPEISLKGLVYWLA